ncbi:MAG: hypothetical protein IPI67_20310 [Myxococcales bacterium]|nr:hypothetical protein [Myxococcales bacterium]
MDGDATPGKELAVLSASRLLVLTVSGRTLGELFSDEQGGKKVRAADVNGDSVDDLLVSEDERVVVMLGRPHR